MLDLYVYNTTVLTLSGVTPRLPGSPYIEVTSGVASGVAYSGMATLFYFNNDEWHRSELGNLRELLYSGSNRM